MQKNENKEVTITQFLHPGAEAQPKRKSDSYIEWNTGTHKRKFLRSKADVVNAKGEVEKNVDIAFWGEWEPKSSIVELKTDEDLPKWLNTPLWETNPSVIGQNTDPLVFGENFQYFICQQGSKVSLRNLESNSIILFGSCIGGNFCLDTVFVVGDKHPFSLSNLKGQIKNNCLFDEVVVKPLFEDECFVEKCNSKKAKNSKCGSSIEYVKYSGVNFKEKNDFRGAFSFVPCKIIQGNEDKEFAFLRPIIELDSIISNKLNQGIKNTTMSIECSISYWHTIVEILEKKDLSIGVNIRNPKSV
jgi:hypothetical protein